MNEKNLYTSWKNYLQLVMVVHTDKLMRLSLNDHSKFWIFLGLQKWVFQASLGYILKSCLTKKNTFTSNISNTPDAAYKYDYAPMHTSTVKILIWSFFPSTCAFLQQNTEIITICFPREMILINIPSKHANHPAPQKWIQFISGKQFPFPQKAHNF